MSKLNLINDLTISGTITELHRCGVVSYKVLMYRDIYYDVDVLLKMGTEKTVAKQQVADRFGVCLKTVYNAIKFMEK
jgi:hypothetical protein